jgi:hypothetical protein
LVGNSRCLARIFSLALGIGGYLIDAIGLFLDA